jgi:Viral coat protein P2 N-terminal domain
VKIFSSLGLMAALAISHLGAFAMGCALKVHNSITMLMHRQGLLLCSYKLNVTDLQNVVPGNVATLKLNAGKGAPTVDLIRLHLSGGATPAHIEYVRGKINGRIFFDEGTGLEIQDRDEYRGIFTEAGFVNLDFTEPKARNGAAEQMVAAIPGHLCDSILFEIKLAAAMPGAGRITASINYRPPTGNPYVRKMLNTAQAFSAAGTEGAPNVLYMPVGKAGGKVKRIWLKETTPGNITGVNVRIGNAVAFEATRAQLENDQKRNGLVPQAGLVVLDFIEDGNLGGLLPSDLAPNVDVRMITGVGETVKAYVEYLDPIDRL